MFFCSISGEPPQDAVVSTKSGHVYERRLILKYITDNGTDPITGERLTEADLVSVKSSESLLTSTFFKSKQFLFCHRSWSSSSPSTDTNVDSSLVTHAAKRMGRVGLGDLHAQTTIQCRSTTAEWRVVQAGRCFEGDCEVVEGEGLGQRVRLLPSLLMYS